MGSVQQAVLEFDEEVRAPWRPRLVVVGSAAGGAADAAPMRPPLPRSSRRSPSRVGVCRPPDTPAAPARRPAGPRPEGRRAEGMCTEPATGGRPRPAERRRTASMGVETGRLRPTRRARRLAVVVALVAGMALGSWVDHLVDGDAGGLRLAGESSVVVRPGDTLWSIASSLEGGGDVRALIDEIQALNGLSGTELQPGQTLLLP